MIFDQGKKKMMIEFLHSVQVASNRTAIHLNVCTPWLVFLAPSLAKGLVLTMVSRIPSTDRLRGIIDFASKV